MMFHHDKNLIDIQTPNQDKRNYNNFCERNADTIIFKYFYLTTLSNAEIIYR